MKKTIITALIGIAIGFLGAFIFIHKPDSKITTQTVTVESKYWKAQYTVLQKNWKKEVDANVKTVCVTVNTYTPTGSIATQTVSSTTVDLSTIHSTGTSTSVTTVTTAGQTIEHEKIVEKIVNYTGSIALGVNPLNTSEFAADFQYDIFKPVFLEILAHNDFKANNSGGYALLGLRF